MTEADWLHLKPYGYAPGSYTKKCLFCDSIMRDVDKSATKCRYCAEQKHAEASAAPPVAPHTEAERLAQALEREADEMHAVSDRQRAKLREAAAELRRLSADARRLDWLEADKGRRVTELGGRWYVRANFGQPHRRAATLRAAIDQAMDGK